MSKLEYSKPPGKYRKKNFSDAEITRLITLFNENRDMLSSRLNNALSVKAKTEIWSHITHEVNYEHVEKRTVAEIKHKWKDLVTRAKKDLANRKKLLKLGGPMHPESPYTDIVLDIISDGSPNVVVIMPESADGQEGMVDNMDYPELDLRHYELNETDGRPM